MLNKFVNSAKYYISIFLMVLLLIRCSSDSNIESTPQKKVPKNNTYVDMEEKLYKNKFGAIDQGRNYIDEYLPWIQAYDIKLDKGITNISSYKSQINEIQSSMNYLKDDNSPVYNKINTWLNAGGDIQELSQYGIKTNLLRGDDGYQNVLLTGYYSPILHASLTKNSIYKYPMYRKPQSDSLRRKSREEIYNGALANQGLEIAYTKSMLDNFLFGVQGSGFVDLGNGKLTYFSYDGQNGHPYQAIGRLLVEADQMTKESMSIPSIRRWAANQSEDAVKKLLIQNPAFVYYKMNFKNKVIGSAGVPLIPMAAVASDRNVVPSGSVLLVEVPDVDKAGNWKGTHKPYLMVALDTGGAIKRHHLDLYFGIGEAAESKAGLLKHYGRVWVLN